MGKASKKLDLSLTKERKQEIAKQLFQGTLYAYNTQDKINCSGIEFLIACMDEKERKKLDAANPYMVVGGPQFFPMACNGIPMPMQIQFILKEDWDDIVKMHNKAVEVFKSDNGEKEKHNISENKKQNTKNRKKAH